MATGDHHAGNFGSLRHRKSVSAGDYIKTVVLNSPGGSIDDALAMGRLIREKKFATEVEAGKILRVILPVGVCRRRPSAVPAKR